MQLHAHSQIAHVCRTVFDGKWRAPDSLGYREHVAATGSLVAQHLEEAMTRRFGVRWVPRADGRGFEIAGISPELMSVFSSRRAGIDAATLKLAAQFQTRYGRVPSQRELGDLREQANLRTRAGKQDGAIDWDALRKDWAARVRPRQTRTTPGPHGSMSDARADTQGGADGAGAPAGQYLHSRGPRQASGPGAAPHRRGPGRPSSPCVSHWFAASRTV